MFIVSQTTRICLPYRAALWVARNPLSTQYLLCYFGSVFGHFESNFSIDSTCEERRPRNADSPTPISFKCKILCTLECFVQNGSSFPLRPVRYISCYLSSSYCPPVLRPQYPFPPDSSWSPLCVPFFLFFSILFYVSIFVLLEHLSFMGVI